MTVAGFGRSPERLERARELGAIDVAAGSLEEALDGAEACFCCAPVGSLPAQVGAALAAAPRRLRGHRRGLGQGAPGRRDRGPALRGRATRWRGPRPPGWSTPAPTSSRARSGTSPPRPRPPGLLYERLHRLIVALGARPAAIEPAAHDRLLAAVSHLPHVVANVLVGPGRPPGASRPGSARASATPPAWPAPTRRSGPTSTWPTGWPSPTRWTRPPSACAGWPRICAPSDADGAGRLAGRGARGARPAAVGRVARRAGCTSCA